MRDRINRVLLQVMKRAHKYLVSKGKVLSSEQSFKLKLYELWFKVGANSVYTGI